MKNMKSFGIVIGAVILGILFFFSLNNNAFHIAPDRLYYKYQWDAEALVAGRIAADLYNKDIPGNTHLALVQVNDGASWHMQAYGLIKNDVLANFNVPLHAVEELPATLQNQAQKYMSVVLPYSQALEQYIGRNIDIAGKQRTISFIEQVGNYAIVYVSGNALSGEEKNATTAKISGEPINTDLIQVQAYKSQYGLQGSFFSKLALSCGFDIDDLNQLTSLLFIVVIVVLTLLYARIFPFLFTVIFFFSLFLSPWITVIAKNLYWFPALWFFPALCIAAFLLSRVVYLKVFFLLLAYLAFTIKCLTGYEFISTIILFAAAPCLYLFVTHIHEQTKWRYIKYFLLICLIGAAGFTTALLIHAGTRGDTILDGLKSIYELDVKRRTYDDPSLYTDDTRYEVYASLATSVWSVLWTYMSSWYTNVIKFLPSWTFVPLMFGATATCIGSLFSKSRQALINIGLFIAFVPPAFSWHILAKAHSYVHPHINYVLWYFGAVAAIIYICINGANSLMTLLSGKSSSTQTDTK